ncbi:Cro/CI family transcriptional regulator [Photobacterium sp. R1]
MKTSEVVQFFGSKSKVARALKVHRSTVTNWGEEVPELQAYRIEKLTKGKLKADFPFAA